MFKNKVHVELSKRWIDYSTDNSNSDLFTQKGREYLRSLKISSVIVNSGAWQTQTKYQQMMGIVPSPGIAIIVNLANLQPFQMNFNQSNPI